MGERVKSLEGKYPDDADREFFIQAILSRLEDVDLDILEFAAKFKEQDHTMAEVKQYLSDLGKMDQYQKTCERFKQIKIELVERCKKGDLPGVLIAGVERWW
jgi:hypothetical protein